MRSSLIAGFTLFGPLLPAVVIVVVDVEGSLAVIINLKGPALSDKISALSLTSARMHMYMHMHIHMHMYACMHMHASYEYPYMK